MLLAQLHALWTNGIKVVARHGREQAEYGGQKLWFTLQKSIYFFPLPSRVLVALSIFIEGACTMGPLIKDALKDEKDNLKITLNKTGQPLYKGQEAESLVCQGNEVPVYSLALS